MKVHYWENKEHVSEVAVAYGPKLTPACGPTTGRKVVFTDNKRRVTCKNCKRTFK